MRFGTTKVDAQRRFDLRKPTTIHRWLNSSTTTPQMHPIKHAIFSLLFLVLCPIIHAVYSTQFIRFKAEADLSHIVISKPNVVFILADDLGYGDLGCYGNTILNTPNLDRLAAEGLILNQHYSASPLCAPARAGLLTGRYNHRTGAISVESNRGLDRIALEETTIADDFNQAGYVTAMIGKWHNGLYDMRYHPIARGFDHFLGFLNGGMYYYNWILDRDGYSERSDKRYLTDMFTDEAVGFISVKRQDPFLLYLSYNSPHSPLEAPQELVEKYMQMGKLNKGVATLYAMIESMDTGIGKVLDSLKETGQAYNTIVVFTSDNGPLLGNYSSDEGKYNMDRYNGSLRGMKQDVLEGGIRVPCLVRWPKGFKGGKTLNPVGHFIDWRPTLIDAAGIKSASTLPLDGRSLLSSFRTGQDDHVRSLFWQFNRYDPEVHCNSAVRNGPWKLYYPRIPEAMIKLKSDGPPYRELFDRPHFEMEISNPPVERTLSDARAPELYNIEEDPSETNNLADQYPELVSELKSQLENWFEDVME